ISRAAAISVRVRPEAASSITCGALARACGGCPLYLPSAFAGDPGPLFVNFDRAGKGQRLTGAAVYHIVGWLGAKAGLTVRPQGLRHLAITTALDRTNGDVRAVATFSRHQDLHTLSRYHDNRPDLAGTVASLVAAE